MCGQDFAAGMCDKKKFDSKPVAGELSSEETKGVISFAICLWSPDSYRGSEMTLSVHSQGSLKHRAPRKDGFHPGEAKGEREAFPLVL